MYLSVNTPAIKDKLPDLRAILCNMRRGKSTGKSIGPRHCHIFVSQKIKNHLYFGQISVTGVW
jgi:hypothetical protein